MIETNGERESGTSVLAARHDDDDYDDEYNFMLVKSTIHSLHIFLFSKNTSIA